MSQEKIILIGGGGHCAACIDVIEQEGKYEIEGILDLPNKVGSKILGYSIIGTDEDLGKYKNTNTKFLITVGQIKSSELRKKLFSKLSDFGLSCVSIKSPRSYVAKEVVVGVGTILMHDVVINSAATVGMNCIINTKVLIEHNAKIGDHCHVSTGAIVNGDCEIGSGVFIGSGAVCVNGKSIPENSFVKANSLVK